MSLTVREMHLDEVPIMSEYFLGLAPDELDVLGVDPTKVPDRGRFLAYAERELQRPYDQRQSICVTWLADDTVVGFSTVDTIKFGRSAKMHLHVLRPENRKRGLGLEGTQLSARFYFEILQLERLFCEPNAFNIAPNRTLQRAGFRYVKTYETNPGYINYHQTVTRWVLARSRMKSLDDTSA